MTTQGRTLPPEPPQRNASSPELEAANERLLEKRHRIAAATGRRPARVVPHPSASVAPPDEEPSAAAEERSARNTLVSPGRYRVVFDRERLEHLFGRRVWLVQFAIADQGEHLGAPLIYPLTALQEKRAPALGSAYVRAYAIATGRRPPRDLWRRRPRWFLSGCMFLAEVRTITRNSQKQELPAVLHYSRVDHLVERIAGSPPCLLEAAR